MIVCEKWIFKVAHAAFMMLTLTFVFELNTRLTINIAFKIIKYT